VASDRLAEDYATADILTGGRLIFGIGRGYHTREVESFGNPMLDGEANRELFEEQLEIILKAFKPGVLLARREVLHDSARGCVPRLSAERAHARAAAGAPSRGDLAAIVSGSARGLEFMAKHGIKGVVSATAEQFVDRWFRDYQAVSRRHGRELELGEDLILGFRMSIDDTQSWPSAGRGPISRSTPSSWARSECCATAKST